MQANERLDEIDKKLLNEIQWVFPLADRPYLEIAERHGISEQDVMRRIAALKSMGLVRQINAIFDTRRLGYKSALVGKYHFAGAEFCFAGADVKRTALVNQRRLLRMRNRRSDAEETREKNDQEGFLALRF